MPSRAGRSSDPLTGFTFRLELEGKAAGYFTEVTGIGSETEVINQPVTDAKGHDLIQKVPGRLKWTDINLKRGITEDMALVKWRQLVIDGKVKEARTNCSIIMCDRNYQDVARWDFVNAWPSKLSGPSLKADSNELGIEEMTIVHEGIKRNS